MAFAKQRVFHKSFRAMKVPFHGSAFLRLSAAGTAATDKRRLPNPRPW
eukprot:SAG25_NODE_4958_length_724_cov_1.131200_2_plen_48_part_00